MKSAKAMRMVKGSERYGLRTGGRQKMGQRLRNYWILFSILIGHSLWAETPKMLLPAKDSELKLMLRGIHSRSEKGKQSTENSLKKSLEVFYLNF